MLKFDWLYYFVVLVESANFSEASRRLFITQQALSKAISQLEKHLKVQLIERFPWKLTAAGELLFLEARSILQQANQIEAAFQHHPGEALDGTLHLAMLSYLEAGLMTTFKQLMLAHPDLSVHMQTDLSATEMEQQLLSQQLDLAIMPCQPISKGLKSLYYASSPLILVAAPALARPSTLDWHALGHIACQAPEPMGRILAWPEETCPRSIVAEADLQTALDLALAGHGALWVPEYAVRVQLGEGSLQRLNDPPFERRVFLYVVWAAAKGHCPLLQRIIQALRPSH